MYVFVRGFVIRQAGVFRLTVDQELMFKQKETTSAHWMEKLGFRERTLGIARSIRT